jgi:hypothetical protein
LDRKFRLSRTIPGTWAGKTFDDLGGTERQFILTHSFSCEIFHGISDAAVLEIFARLNTYNVALNAQELRNGRFFGLFKQSAYELAHEHLEFWRQQRIFSERSIARMLEVELTSELLIAQIAGMQDKKKTIDQFYRSHDEHFPNRGPLETQFRATIDTINETFENTLHATEFFRVPLFYTLFCAIFHYQYGLPNTALTTPRRELSRTQRLSLVEAVQHLSDLIGSGRDGEPIRGEAGNFVDACLRQTDNIRPRVDRLNFLYKQAFGE